MLHCFENKNSQNSCRRIGNADLRSDWNNIISIFNYIFGSGNLCGIYIYHGKTIDWDIRKQTDTMASDSHKWSWVLVLIN